MSKCTIIIFGEGRPYKWHNVTNLRSAQAYLNRSRVWYYFNVYHAGGYVGRVYPNGSCPVRWSDL